MDEGRDVERRFVRLGYMRDRPKAGPCVRNVPYRLTSSHPIDGNRPAEFPPMNIHP